MQTKPERIAKVIARHGIASRRQAEKLVENGCVKVNGQVIHSPALNIRADDTIEVNGKTLTEKATVNLWAYNKPTGYLTTRHDPQAAQPCLPTSARCRLISWRLAA